MDKELKLIIYETNQIKIQPQIMKYIRFESRVVRSRGAAHWCPQINGPEYLVWVNSINETFHQYGGFTNDSNDNDLLEKVSMKL